MIATQYDEKKAEMFTERTMTMMNHGAMCLMLSIGHRTGLFDTMRELPPSTSRQIADAADLDERYVREWLGAMAAGEVVEHCAETRTYLLPPEHAACLTRAASPANMAVSIQFLPILAGVEDQIVSCFRNGGGVPYGEYSRFHEVMAEESGQTVVAGLMDHILPLVPDVMDKLERGIDVLDVGCGRGRALIVLAEAFPRSRFVGRDFSEEAIESAMCEVTRKGLTNIRFEACDAAGINETATFDLITAFDAIHDQADPAGVLAAIERALKRDGTFLMQDIAGSSHVHNNIGSGLAPFTYTISCMHCMSVSLAQGGAGLGAAWGEELAQEMLADAGFENVHMQRLPHDEINVYFVARKS